MVVTTDGIVNRWLSVFVVVMVDSGRSGWVLGGEMVLLTADGCVDDGCAWRVPARYVWSIWLFSSTIVANFPTVRARRLRSAEMVRS